MNARDHAIVTRLEASGKLDDCAKAVAELEKRAGIAMEAERAYEGPLFPLMSEAPIGGEQHRLDNEAYWDDQRRFRSHHLRKAYFSVKNIELRKQLIAKQIECDELRRQCFRVDVKNADIALNVARGSQKYWWLSASVTAIGAVAVGHRFFGIAGAIGGAVVGLFCGRAIEEDAKRSRAFNVEQAEKDLAEAKSSLQDILRESPTFSCEEERTGELGTSV